MTDRATPEYPEQPLFDLHRVSDGHSTAGLGQLVLGGLALGAIVAFVASASALHPTRPDDLRAARASGVVRLTSSATSYAYHPSSGRLSASLRDGSVARDTTLAIVVDGEARPLAIERLERRAAEKNAFGASFPLAIGEDNFDALFTLRVDAASGALVAGLSVQPLDATSAHTFALRLQVPTEGERAFVSGRGELADVGTVKGRIVEIDAGSRAVGIVSGHGVLDVAAVIDDDAERGSPLWITATSPAEIPTPAQPATGNLRFVLGASTSRIWRTLYEMAGEPTARVGGLVTGAPRARIFGLDAEGLPRVRAEADPSGRFEVFVPKNVIEWYAAREARETSAPIQFTPGTPYDLRLDVSPGGELRVKVNDADTGSPLTARLLVRGVGGTFDPSFGPDYRASGAGPIVDSLHGDVATPLPAGHYRVSATKGIEWSIDSQLVEITSGHTSEVTLEPRHVVPTPGQVGCDLHVHARPSFDAPVQPEDRVLSLVSAGIDFAVPSEHNVVGDYAPALEVTGLAKQLATVTGVEVTTYSPRIGHFGVFPFPTSEKPPPFKATTWGAVFKAAHKSDPTRVLQVNHPRLPMAIGYFEIAHFDSKRPPPASMRTDFDTLEVYNGYDLEAPLRIEQVIRDWFALLDMGYRYAATGSSDSHRIQYQWAGYPRTLVRAADDPIDVKEVVANIKKGRSVVTSGPIVDVRIGSARPGDTVTPNPQTDSVVAHVVVRAAPWVDVSSLELVVGGRPIQLIPIASRPTITGPELGTLEEAQARTVRFEGDFPIPLGDAATWVVALARGKRLLDDVLPFMPIAPLGFSNPIFIARR